MKKILCAVMVIATCLMCLASCTVKFEYVDGQLLNKRTKEKYNALPIGFEPSGVGEQYGQFGAFKLYRIIDLNGNELSPKTWVTEEYAGNATVVYLNESTPVPVFENMTFDVCYVCEEDEVVFSLATIDSDEKITEIVSAAKSETGEEVFWPGVDIKASYSLKLYSLEYPAVFYSVNYRITEQGNYIYNIATGQTINVGDMLTEYVNADGNS